MGDGAFKKNEKKKREIIRGGTTTILVSHSIAQVREGCSKILRLDKGRQSALGNEVQLYCDAYEEYLMANRLPENREDIERLAKAFSERCARTEKQTIAAASANAPLTHSSATGTPSAPDVCTAE